MIDGFGYGAGINPALANAGCAAPGVVSPAAGKECKHGENGFLILLLLFILLASCTTMGREKNFFFIIILAIIAFGGFSRTFGLGGPIL
ncbi:MAG: hypothetical protein ACM3TR_06700 [Caulobacteraceae bacterium]